MHHQTQEDKLMHVFKVLLARTKLQKLSAYTGVSRRHKKRSTKGMVEELEISEIDVTDQKAIAHILGIQTIRSNSTKDEPTLEEIAKAIFKSWFVDFDPVRAKAEGRPTGLPLK